MIFRHAWGAQVVALGAWEAFSLSGRTPTVTCMVRRCRGRNRTATQVVVGAWLIGLGAHLLYGPRLR